MVKNWHIIAGLTVAGVGFWAWKKWTAAQVDPTVPTPTQVQGGSNLPVGNRYVQSPARAASQVATRPDIAARAEANAQAKAAALSGGGIAAAQRTIALAGVGVSYARAVDASLTDASATWAAAKSTLNATAEAAQTQASNAEQGVSNFVAAVDNVGAQVASAPQRWL